MVSKRVSVIDRTDPEMETEKARLLRLLDLTAHPLDGKAVVQRCLVNTALLLKAKDISVLRSKADLSDSEILR